MGHNGSRSTERTHEGDIIEGEVSSLTDFGVFVNVGAVDGLVHMSEITWKRNVRIRDSFKKGDKVTVKVIEIDRENDRISLSIKPTTVIHARWNKKRNLSENLSIVAAPNSSFS